MCATCNKSLKNVGYFNIGGKFYCEVCARAAKAAQIIGIQQQFKVFIRPPTCSELGMGSKAKCKVFKYALFVGRNKLLVKALALSK